MPESPEIRVMSDYLNRKFKGKLCEGVAINHKSKFFTDGKFFSSSVELSQLEGVEELGVGINEICLGVHSIGKKIFFIFEGFIFISSCGMKGQWRFTEGEWSGIIIQFENNQYAYFDDSAKRANFSIVYHNSSEYYHIRNEVGPDIMSDETTFDVFEKAITNCRIKNKEVHTFLHEQKRISGLGAYLIAEVLYHSQVDPRRLLCSLSLEDRQNIFQCAKYVTFDSYEKGGHTLESYRDPEGNIGMFKPSVYGRQYDPDGNEVKFFIYDKKRKMYYVPAFQK